jgi:hypothetical protein
MRTVRSGMPCAVTYVIVHTAAGSDLSDRSLTTTGFFEARAAPPACWAIPNSCRVSRIVSVVTSTGTAAISAAATKHDSLPDVRLTMSSFLTPFE